ncbi:Glucose 1-dehydrogenase 4 [Arthrobacter sp. SO5]|uniref:SDR family NAD(P)-dependent oxidoreductase n=1 Tax=Arthrobacter sp. SO5 TaxID=1897055 RepID=UPI001E40103C|nr:SDR family NAD(P)-dependent oxidoreductase [Arthrobacter sp. SO5]MCB5272801.1 Glucose 1-dehydrogenase 4 [Arthrobacter sp. SO5]
MGAATAPNAKTILLTGGNRGIGRLTVLELLRRGHRVVFTARHPAAGVAAHAEFERSVPGARVEVKELDLASLASVRALAAALLREGVALDAIVHNAGTLIPPPRRTLTADGLEETLQVHAVGPFLLSTLLLPALSRPARLLFLASNLHAPDSRGTPVRFRFEDPFLAEGYHADRAYKNAKLAQLWLMAEWERRHGPEGVHADALCPGFVPRTAAGTAHGAMRPLLRWVLPLMPFATSPEAAALLAADWAERDAASPGGLYCDGTTITAPSPEAQDPERARAFWELLEGWAPASHAG